VKIRGWQIDGYGVLRGHSISGLPDGLTLVYGPNEAGKTTLLAFLRGVLFGFPGPDAPDHVYSTIPGGSAGGSLVLESRDGAVAVTRAATGDAVPEVVLPGGRVGTEGDLRSLLGGVDGPLYRSVFAFSLAELQALSTLPRHEVRERLLSAAIAGAGRSGRASIADLETRAATLLETGGTAAVGPARGEIDDLVASLASARARLAAARAEAATYGSLRDEDGRLAAEIPRLSDRIAEAREGLHAGRLLLDSWPDFERLQEATRELNELLSIVRFPADPETRLVEANRVVSDAVVAIRDIEAAQADTEAAIAPLAVDSALAAVANEIDELERLLPLHRDRRARREAAHRQADEADQAVVDQLRAAGPAWSEARIAGEDGAADRRDEVREWGARIAAADAAVERRRAERAAVTTRLEGLDATRSQVRGLFGPQEPPGQDALDEREVVVRRLREAFDAHRSAEADTGLRESIVAERRRAVDGDEPKPEPLVPAWLPTVGLAAALVSVGVAVQRTAVGDVAAALGFGLLAAAVVLAVLGLRVVDRRLALQEARGEKALSVRRLELADATRARDESLARASTLRLALEREAASAGIEAPTADAVAAVEETLAADSAARVRWDELLTRLSGVHDQTRATEEDLVRAETALQSAQDEQRRIDDAWAAWQLEFGTPGMLPPAQVLELIAGLRAARLALRERNRQRAEAADLDIEIAAWEERARTTVVAAGVGPAAGVAGPPSGEELIAAYLEVQRRSQEDRRTRAALARLQEELLRREPQIAAAHRALQRAESERRDLFASVGVSSEDGFRERLEIHARQVHLRTLIRELESQLVGRLGRGEDAESVRAELKRARADRWTALTQDAESELAESSVARDAALRRRGEVQAHCRALEASEAVASSAMEVEALRTELARRVREWRTLRAAVGLIEVSLGQLARSRQPAVVAEAARMFRGVTEGRYVAIEQDEAGSSLVLVDALGTRRTLDQLSRGTAEQLYLCLRLALVADRARHGETPAVVMDDVLVNFDDARARAVTAVLAELAQEQQVLLFTCHRAIRDLVRDAVRGVRVVELPLSPLVPVAARSDPASAGGRNRARSGRVGNRGPRKSEAEEPSPA
jgi:uncharacterized protein YhaN